MTKIISNFDNLDEGLADLNEEEVKAVVKVGRWVQENYDKYGILNRYPDLKKLADFTEQVRERFADIGFVAEFSFSELTKPRMPQIKVMQRIFRDGKITEENIKALEKEKGIKVNRD